MTRLSITGVGAVTAVGVGFDSLTTTLADSRAAAERAFGRTPTVIDLEKVPSASGAEAWDFDPTEFLGKKGLRNFDRLTTMLIVSAKHALEHAGIKENGAFARYRPERVGVCSATAYGSLDAISELQEIAELEDPRYINPSRFPNTVINAAAGYVSIWEDLRAPNATIVDGNCGSLDAVLTASTHLACGRADAFLVGGGEVLSTPLYIALRKLGALAEGGRAGLTLGEGAAYVMVERPDAAAERALCHIVGYGTAFEPPESQVLLVHGSAQAVERAMAAAIRDAGLSFEDVDAVMLASSGLPMLDDAEREAVETHCPRAGLAVPKRIFGETLGAAGAHAMGLAVGLLGGQKRSPALAYEQPLWERPPQNERVGHVLVLTKGFYGNVSAVVLAAAD